MGPQIPLFWTSGNVSSGFQSQSAALFALGGGICITHSLGFTSGATPADLLAASIAAKPSFPATLWGIGGTRNQDHAAAHSVRFGRLDALPTELSRCTVIKVPHPKKEEGPVLLLQNYPHPLNLRAEALITSPLPLTLEPQEHDHHLSFYFFPP